MNLVRIQMYYDTRCEIEMKDNLYYLNNLQASTNQVLYMVRNISQKNNQKKVDPSDDGVNSNYDVMIVYAI